MPSKKYIILNHERVENKENVLKWFELNYEPTEKSAKEVLILKDIYNNYKTTQLELNDQRYFRYRAFQYCFTKNIVKIDSGNKFVINDYKRKI
jgi:anaerobic ribonucleoside-triphosphate reductase